ncbi:MAG: WYL domain-containing protein [Pseudonocardia sp.]|uniref:helix-turn-helix transcriptional regulator n=1 Tax=unclassified Pseudonocardia TaxID=2619320 RepID=UPI00086E3BA0|nr:MULTISPECIES: WYL domain-containing protein [unclassified Pseudonocardia]MBN9109986.1 WYL domain-containing protein [Pseudonocardia sp.]ODU25379.1 MAG: transcriptional regulator [Pseudonocardia sp. SCN 72-51]ODV03302.1 MAG: transcriptional regulator [Pseudonocardia sp. SCN 73-27]
MRASRLIALLFVLQRRRSATAAELAAELEVSERTIYRDVAALVEAGVPLWTEGGHGGGIRLVEGWRTRLDGLTAQEAAAMLATAAPQLLTALGMGSALVAAQSKMLATLPADLGEHARRIAERVHLDAPGWFQTPAEPPHLATLAQAVWAQKRVRIGYRRGSGTVGRVVEPLGLVLKAGVWYLVAGVADSEDVRTYRASRVVDAEATGDRFERPEGFDLPGWWAESAARFAGTMLRASVRIRLTPRGLRALPHVTDTDAATAAVAAAGPPDTDGWREVTLEVESVEVAAGQLVALAGEVEALDPAVRTLLATHARALLDNNS